LAVKSDIFQNRPELPGGLENIRFPPIAKA
jgi:hypothetical protein